jgi:SAM-dependent methyltransferase
MMSTLAAAVRAAGSVKRRSPANLRSLAGNRQKIEEVYGGSQGALLAIASAMSGHRGAAERILRDRQFDLRGLRSLLDVGSGAGQLAKPLLQYADAHAEITCCDLSTAMLHRTRTRLASARPRFVVADLSRLPFADDSFDGITCGYVLEHLTDPRAGLAELSRVLVPDGRLLLLTIEDNLFGALTSQAWCCRVHNRSELRTHCVSAGLVWKKEIKIPRWHQLPWIDGICVELHKPNLLIKRLGQRKRSSNTY